MNNISNKNIGKIIGKVTILYFTRETKFFKFPKILPASEWAQF